MTDGATTTDGAIRCAIAVAMYLVETMAMILGCGVPEPFEPIVCTVALAAWFYAGYETAEACAG